MENNNDLPILNEAEVRVLGALIEKSITTPDYYPMTLNSLTAACNQKSSRKPIVNYNEETVITALNSLKALSMVATAIGGSSRSTKYKHNFTTVYPLSNGELAVLCLLFLRGPLTPGEINSNSGRLHEFKSLESVNDCLTKLINASPPFVKELPKRAGQKETRFVQLLTPLNTNYEEEITEESANKTTNSLENRLLLVETELEEIKQKINHLMNELLG